MCRPSSSLFEQTPSLFEQNHPHSPNKTNCLEAIHGLHGDETIVVVRDSLRKMTRGVSGRANSSRFGFGTYTVVTRVASSFCPVLLDMRSNHGVFHNSEMENGNLIYLVTDWRVEVATQAPESAQVCGYEIRRANDHERRSAATQFLIVHYVCRIRRKTWHIPEILSWAQLQACDPPMAPALTTRSGQP